MQIEELNGTNCRTYLLTVGKEAILVDPVRDRVDTYRQLLAARALSLRMILETHLHADHLMLNRGAQKLFGVPVAMHRESPSPLVDRHLTDGEIIFLGGEPIEVLHTPGHTPDSVCYRLPGAVLTGDTLTIQGTGRADFPGADAGKQFDAVTQRLFALPDETVVWPAHEYKGRVSSTIGDEKRTNPRIVGRTREAYIELMANLKLPFPLTAEQVLQVNQSGFEFEDLTFPLVAEVARMEPLTPVALAERMSSPSAPLLLDVREPEEFVGELGHIAGSLLVPLDALEHRLPKLAGYHDRDVVVVCRAGARSATAGAILHRAGFHKVENLDGGMLAWVAARLPVQH